MAPQPSIATATFGLATSGAAKEPTTQPQATGMSRSYAVSARPDLRTIPEDGPPQLTITEELVNHLISENKDLARRVDDIETKLSKRMGELGDASVKLSQRTDELENGVSVVIHDLLNLRRQIEVQLSETSQRQDEELKNFESAVQTFMTDLTAYKSTLKEPPMDRVVDSTRVAVDHLDSKSAALRELSGMAKTAPIPLYSDGHDYNARRDLPSRMSSQMSLPARGEQSPVRSFSDAVQREASAVDRRASPVSNLVAEGHSSIQQDARALNRRASPVRSKMPEGQSSIQCQVRMLNQMISESEVTLGKIKAADTVGQKINSSCGPIAITQDGVQRRTSTNPSRPSPFIHVRETGQPNAV